MIRDVEEGWRRWWRERGEGIEAGPQAAALRAAFFAGAAMVYYLFDETLVEQGAVGEVHELATCADELWRGA